VSQRFILISNKQPCHWGSWVNLCSNGLGWPRPRATGTLSPGVRGARGRPLPGLARAAGRRRVLPRFAPAVLRRPCSLIFFFLILLGCKHLIFAHANIGIVRGSQNSVLLPVLYQLEILSWWLKRKKHLCGYVLEFPHKIFAPQNGCTDKFPSCQQCLFLGCVHSHACHVTALCWDRVCVFNRRKQHKSVLWKCLSSPDSPPGLCMWVSNLIFQIVPWDKC